LALEESESVREAVADAMLRQHKPAEAESYLRHVIDKQIPDRVDLVYRLAQGYQAQGDHQRALDLFAQCELINPGIGEDATFKRLREASAEKLGTNVPVKPA